MSDAIQLADVQRNALVHTEVDYLPATHPYKHSYSDGTQLITVRSDSMAFFGVSDHKDRDVHEFYLVFNGGRITDLTKTLGQLLGDKREAEFDLVEQITPGAG
jgi:hypothetical protein